jgi:hypothetical protein
MTKIGENYHATLKNPTSHGGVRGIFMSKNTTQNSIFFENPTPRGGILKYHELDPTRGEISSVYSGKTAVLYFRNRLRKSTAVAVL